MTRYIIFFIYFFAVSDVFAALPTTDEFVKKFCEYARVPNGEYSFLQNIDSTDKLFPCYSGMAYAVPNKIWNGKQWTVDRTGNVTAEDIIKSAVIYFGFPLAAESPDSNLYIKTIHELKGVRVPANKEILHLDHAFKSFIEDLQKASQDITSDKRQMYFPDGPLKNGLSISLHVPEYSAFHQYAGSYVDVQNASKKVNAVGLWGNATSRERDAKAWGAFFTASNMHN